MNITLNVNFGLTPGAETFITKLLSSVAMTAPQLAAELSAPVVSDVSADKAPEPVAKAEEKPAPKPRGRPKKDEPVVTPPAPEPEVAAQDDADEIAEVEADAPATDEVETFTRDSIRTELGNYAKAYGMEHALTDGPSIIEAKNASAVEETQEALGKATRALRAAIVSNPFERAPADAAA